MSRQNRERGAVAVEFALILPLFVLIVFGIIEFGRVYEIQTTLSGASREGVRVMALQNDKTAARTTVKNVASGLGVTDAEIAVGPTTCATSGTALPARATVTVTHPVKLMTGLFGATITLTGKASMRCNG